MTTKTTYQFYLCTFCIHKGRHKDQVTTPQTQTLHTKKAGTTTHQKLQSERTKRHVMDQFVPMLKKTCQHEMSATSTKQILGESHPFLTTSTCHHPPTYTATGFLPFGISQYKLENLAENLATGMQFWSHHVWLTHTLEYQPYADDSHWPMMTWLYPYLYTYISIFNFKFLDPGIALAILPSTGICILFTLVGNNTNSITQFLKKK